MRVLLLAGGYGTRLRPLTDFTPKCLIPINGKPLLRIWLERLTQAGLGPFLINTHYLSTQVEAFIKSTPYQNFVTLVHEKKLLGTAGTLIKNLAYFQGKEGMLIHADNFCLADFEKFQSVHHQRPPQCVMTMMTFRTDSPSSCGIIEIDHRGIVVGFHEKVSNPPGNLANGAIYALSAEMLMEISKELPLAKDFSLEIIPRFLGRIYSYEIEESLIDIGTIQKYEMANQIAKGRKND